MTKKNLIIFLDFDGVLVTARSTMDSFKNNGGIISEANQDSVKAFNLLQKYFSVEIVVSSSWRIGLEPEKMRDQLDDWGVNYNSFLGITPHVESHRGKEIMSWMGTHKKEIKDKEFIVVDDESFDILPNIQPKDFCQIENGWFNGGFKKMYVKQIMNKKL